MTDQASPGVEGELSHGSEAVCENLNTAGEKRQRDPESEPSVVSSKRRLTSSHSRGRSVEERTLSILPKILAAPSIAATSVKRRTLCHLDNAEKGYLFPDVDSEGRLVDKRKIAHDELEGLRYVTNLFYGARIHEWIAKLWRVDLRQDQSASIVDGCAGLGGNVLSFALVPELLRLHSRFPRDLFNLHDAKRAADRYEKITAVELDRLRYECLKSNVSLYGLDKAVNCVNEDFLKWFELYKAAGTSPRRLIVFLDPPWGGDDYHKVTEFVDLPLFSLIKEDSTGLAASSGGSVGTLEEYSVVETCRSLLGSGVPMVVLKLPYNFNFRKAFGTVPPPLPSETQLSSGGDSSTKKLSLPPGVPKLVFANRLRKILVVAVCGPLVVSKAQQTMDERHGLPPARQRGIGGFRGGRGRGGDRYRSAGGRRGQSRPAWR